MTREILICFLRQTWLCICILFVASVNTNAQNVSVADAIDKARMLKRSNTISSHSNNTLSGADVSIDLAYTSENKGKTLFYVFNYADGGFAIIGGDEKAKVVLGYSDNGTFNIDSIPEGLKDMLASYSEQISYAIDNNAEVPQMNMSTSKRSIAALLQTKWNQDSPYNSSIPEIGLNYSKFVAGCAPIAAAQIMKYYNYPRSGIGSKSYTTTYNDASNGYTKKITFSADFANTIYDWDNMKNSYSGYSTSVEQQAVGLLVYHVGVAMNANYGQYATGVYTNADLPALKNYFGYSSKATKENRSSYSNSEWENLIYNELALERPIFYAGQATDGGHAFVCDGYDSSYDWYHFNWGWGGYCDGYYPLTGSGALQPNGSGIGGAGTGSAYTSDQYALIGLCPPPPEIKVTGITLGQTSASMTVGETRSLTATITPTNATNKNVTWSSSNTSIATVTSSGVVTAIKAGSATITATASDGSGISATCLVAVTNNFNLSDRKNVVTANTAGATVSFSTSNTYEWEWDTTNNRMRSTNYDVNSSTSQTAINITVTKPTDLSFDYSVSSESSYDKLTITLDGMMVVNAISGKNSSMYNGSLTAGSHILQLTYTKDRSSKSGDDRAYIYNLQLKSSTVLVTGISLNSTSATMTVGDTKSLTATITPTNATNKDITWSSSNTSVATVSTSGVVTAINAGTATITATATDGSGKNASCSLMVKEKEPSVTVTVKFTSGSVSVYDSGDLSDLQMSQGSSGDKLVINLVSGQQYIYNASEIADILFEENGSDNPSSPIDDGTRHNGYEYVDLGLSVKWATMNVGANSPTDAGGYYAWGETETKDCYNPESYKWYVPSMNIHKWSKYVLYPDEAYEGRIDYKSVLDSEDDVASMLWKGKWRMPTEPEFSELLTQCTWVEETIDGVLGIRITSNIEGYKDKSIFLPACGWRDWDNLYKPNDVGVYWASTLSSISESSTYGSTMSFERDYYGNRHLEKSLSTRIYGHNIRPVLPR